MPLKKKQNISSNLSPHAINKYHKLSKNDWEYVKAVKINLRPEKHKKAKTINFRTNDTDHLWLEPHRTAQNISQSQKKIIYKRPHL